MVSLELRFDVYATPFKYRFLGRGIGRGWSWDTSFSALRCRHCPSA
ncbi:hypothetical protein AWB69_00749 [Caballeronia udeis]|uniref:Uncharacterized protein n=1 Tax=Caballeronia udeis TaxID=1232866 RepID=A0A158F788_9BURK|nr:hypothetical protein AWB69_00749 [Caballeronia udeis]